VRTIKKAFISAAAVILQAALCGCSNGNLPGEYSGVLPMPAGGMEIELTLSPDYTFQMQTIYQSDLASSSKEDGSYRISSDKIITLRYPGDGIKYLKQQKDGSLKVLTLNRTEVKGPAKNKYILTKKSNLYF